jgi:serine/threonine protein kinase
MPNNPKPEPTRRPLQATLDTLAAADEPAERTAQGPGGSQPLPPTTPDMPPDLAGLQGYEIVRELGRGGMGVVYLARNRLMDRLEVLKVMNKALVGQPAAVDRFLQEIRSAGRLSHHNVAMAHSAHQLGDLLVLAMEYVEGEDLARVVRARGPLPIQQACYCTHQTATALQRGYELGLVHRDIKPGNVLLSKQGKRQVVKVIDFGLAKAKSEVTTEEGLTGTNQMMGTPGFTAPEQLRDARNADTRSDIYSLGCMLYCLLAGKPPFQGASAYAVLLAQQAGEVRPIQEVRPDVPDELAAIVARMMARNPAERFAQPGEVEAALLPFVKGATASPERSGAASGPGSKPGRPAVLPQDVQPTLPTGVQARLRPTNADAGGEPRAAPPDDPPSLATSLKSRPQSSRPDGGAKNGPAQQDAAPVRRWPRSVWIGTAAGAAAVALIALAGIVIKLSVKTPAGDALLVVEVNEPNPDVFVDDQRVRVTWGNGGHRAEIAVKPGMHEVAVRKDGFEADGKTVTLSDGGRKVLTASLLRLPPDQQAAKADLPTPAGSELAKATSEKSGTNPVAPAPRAGIGVRPQPIDSTGPYGVRAEDVRRAQKAWAKYLGRDVEANVDIGNGVTMTFVLVPPGKFDMGSPPDEMGKNGRYHNESLHEVTLTEAFDLSKYEVTQAQYQALTGKNPSGFKGPDRPVECVTWPEANDFGRLLTNRLSDRYVYRLATEAEWEYSCRGGGPPSQPFGVGDGRFLAPGDANFNNQRRETCKVGSYAPNALGLHDMHGNPMGRSQTRFALRGAHSGWPGAVAGTSPPRSAARRCGKGVRKRAGTALWVSAWPAVVRPPGSKAGSLRSLPSQSTHAVR